MINRRDLLAGATGIAGSLLLKRQTYAQQGSAPGSILYVRAGDVWRWTGGTEDKLIADGSIGDPRWSPDGSEILYVRSGNSYSDLYIRTISSGTDFQLTFNQAVTFDAGSKDYADNSVWAIDPSWAATGLIGYASDYYTPYGRLCLWLIDGPGNDPILASAINIDEGVENICLSSDGSVAAFTSRYADQDTAEYVSYVAIQDLASGEAFPLVDDAGGSFFPSFDPDGQRVAVAIREGEQSDIWLIDRSGGARVRVTENAQAINPCFASNGSWIAYFRMVDYRFEVWASPVTGNQVDEPVKLFAYDDLDPASGLSWMV
jgi:Tol biopolymer transport system component